jgi:uncharacterized protein YcbX
MSAGDVVGTVGALWRFPVKSMLGEEVDSVADAPLPAARIDLADGTTVISDAADADAMLSRFFGREIELGSGRRGGIADQLVQVREQQSTKERNTSWQSAFG